jgi:hypothetical protein
VALVQLVNAYTIEGFVKNVVRSVTKKLHMKQLSGISDAKKLKNVVPTHHTHWLAS